MTRRVIAQRGRICEGSSTLLRVGTARTSLLSGPAGRTLLLLAGVNLLNYLDRFVVSALVESLRAEFALSDFRLGVLMTGFIVVYTVASPLFGALGDRGRRPVLLAIGVAIWSCATVLSGLAAGFVSLLVARAAVGIGEAAYATISPSLIADHFERARRGRAFALFFAAIPVGSALGYVVGGLIDRSFGWRAAFLAAGMPGLLLAFLVSRQPDPPRGGLDGVPTVAPRPLLRSWRALAGEPDVPPRRARLRRLHLRDRRVRLLDAGLPGADPRRAARRGDGPVRRGRRRHRARRDAHRRLARRCAAPALARTPTSGSPASRRSSPRRWRSWRSSASSRPLWLAALVVGSSSSSPPPAPSTT